MQTAIVITRPGARRLQQRIESLRAQYDAVTATNEQAAGAGDNCVWHDNFDYEENQRQMHRLAMAIRELLGVRDRARVIEPPAEPRQVQIGCAVTIEDGTGARRRLVIGGYDDGDPAVGRVSYTAPLGRALLGAEEGDVVTVAIDGQAREFEVMRIEPAREEEA